MRPDLEYSDALWSLGRGTAPPSCLPQARTASPAGRSSTDLVRCAPQTASWPAEAHHQATARPTTPLTALPRPPLVGRPQATRSPARTGGGAPPRGITPVHTRNGPQVGQHSGGRSPRGAHPVGQAKATGAAPGGWPPGARQSAQAAAWGGGRARRTARPASAAPEHVTASAGESLSPSRSAAGVRDCRRWPPPAEDDR